MATEAPKKIALIMGTRPEAIKLCPLYLALAEHTEHFAPELWVTAQHREMLDQVLEVFEVIPTRDFNLMRPNQSLAELTGAVLQHLQDAFREDRPDLVIVQGDTTTVFSAALAAFYENIPVAHVEAGLRTWNPQAPYPEEINRQLTTRLTRYHFAPTTAAEENLKLDRVPEEQIWVTGNTVIDALDIVVHRVREQRPELPTGVPLEELEHNAPLVLITGHRRENFGQGMRNICEAIATLAQEFPETQFVYPVHLNPNVQDTVNAMLQDIGNVHLTPPIGYEGFIWLMDRATVILSDSGGIQEEAPHLGKPVLVMRETTERPEALEAGTSLLVGVDREKIIAETRRLLTDAGHYETMSQAQNPYGDGTACQRILEILRRT